MIAHPPPQVGRGCCSSADVVLFYEHLNGLLGLASGVVGATQTCDIQSFGQCHSHLVGIAVSGKTVVVGYTISGRAEDADIESVEVGCRGVSKISVGIGKGKCRGCCHVVHSGDGAVAAHNEGVSGIGAQLRHMHIELIPYDGVAIL